MASGRRRRADRGARKGWERGPEARCPGPAQMSYTGSLKYRQSTARVGPHEDRHHPGSATWLLGLVRHPGDVLLPVHGAGHPPQQPARPCSSSGLSTKSGPPVRILHVRAPGLEAEHRRRAAPKARCRRCPGPSDAVQPSSLDGRAAVGASEGRGLIDHLVGETRRCRRDLEHPAADSGSTPTIRSRRESVSRCQNAVVGGGRANSIIPVGGSRMCPSAVMYRNDASSVVVMMMNFAVPL